MGLLGATSRLERADTRPIDRARSELTPPRSRGRQARAHREVRTGFSSRYHDAEAIAYETVRIAAENMRCSTGFAIPQYPANRPPVRC